MTYGDAGNNEIGAIELAVERLQKILDRKNTEIETLESRVRELEQQLNDHVCEVVHE